MMFEQSSYTFNENDGIVAITVVSVGDSDLPFDIRIVGGK